MKNLVVVAVILAFCGVVYAKVIRPSPQKRACEQLQSLCGHDVDMDQCRDGFDQAQKLVGAEPIEKATDCMASATTCVEAAGCIAGASMHAFESFGRGFDRAAR